MTHNKPGNILFVSHEISNKNIHNNNNNLVYFGDIIPKIITIKNLKSQLYNANCSFCFSDRATAKHFRHWIFPTLSETNVIRDTAVLRMGTNSITNAEVNKDLVASSIISIAGENVFV